LIQLPSCDKKCKENEYTLAYVNLSDINNCGYFLTINEGSSEVSYYPINLPAKYQTTTGIPKENPIYIQYKLLSETDLFVCDKLFPPSVGTVKYRKLEILRILE
jgi:hypothetical protein